MRAVGLKARRRIRIQLLVVVELERVAIARGGGDGAAEIAVAFARKGNVVVVRDAITGYPVEYTDVIIKNTLSLVAKITTTDELVDLWS